MENEIEEALDTYHPLFGKILDDGVLLIPTSW